MKTILFRKVLVCSIICLLLLTSISSVGSCNGYNSSSSKFSDGGLADNMRVIVRSHIIDILLRTNVFQIHIQNDNDCTVDFYLDINVTSRILGRVIWDMGFGLLKDVNPGFKCHFGYFDYRDYKAKGFLFGFFDVNIKIRVVQDASVKIHTAHGIIFGIAAIVWNFTLI